MIYWLFFLFTVEFDVLRGGCGSVLVGIEKVRRESA